MNTPPTVIQRYRIIKLIGQGGMGALYLAQDPALDRMTAIKVLREDNEELRQRFAREARSAARLSHLNIVTIYDVGEFDGQPFIAMEFVEGKTLAEIIRQRAPAPMRQKLDWMYEICDGLEHAHRAQIIHRDIKPANIMIAANGRVKILDFGIARLGESSMTQAGMLVGTLNYMSPEQIMGQPVHARSDIFAVGAVCYELLAYQQAFAGGLDTGILHRILSTQPDPLEKLCPGIDPELVRIVNRAMVKDPDARYADLSIMRRELDRVRLRFATVEPGATIISRPTDETISVETPAAPVPAPSERRRSGREGLERRRASELASYVAAGREALDDNRLDDAVAAFERALLLDDENVEAMELLDRARTAFDAQQAANWIDEARQALEAGALTKASQLLDQATSLAPNSPVVAAFAERVRKERERRASVADAIAQARRALEDLAYERAVAAANLALAIDPGNADAQTILTRAEVGAAAIRRQQELDRRAAAAVADARARFVRGELDEALTMLQAFTPAHPTVSAALQSLRDEAREIKRRRKIEDERQRQIQDQLELVRLARLAIAAAQFDEARRLLAEADAIPFDNADIAAIAGEIGEAEEAEREEAEQRDAEAAAAKRAADEAAEQQRQQEAARRAAEEAAQRQKQEAAKRAAEEAARLQQLTAQQRAEEAARQKAEALKREEAERERLAAAAALRAKQDEEARRVAAAESARLAEEARLRAAEDARRRAAEEDERRKAEEQKRLAAEAARREKEEAARLKKEAAQRQKDEAAAKKKAEEKRLRDERDRAAEAARLARDAAARAAADRPALDSAATVIVSAEAARTAAGPATASARPLPIKAIGIGVAALIVIVLAVIWQGTSTIVDPPSTTTTSVPTTTSVTTTTPSTTTAPAPPTTSSVVPPPTTSSIVTIVGPGSASLVIDALPWAEVVEVRNDANAVVSLKAGTYTPVALGVPPGRYSVTLRNPNEGTRTVTVTVNARGGRAFAEFRKIDAAEYFKKVGW